MNPYPGKPMQDLEENPSTYVSEKGNSTNGRSRGNTLVYRKKERSGSFAHIICQYPKVLPLSREKQCRNIKFIIRKDPTSITSTSSYVTVSKDSYLQMIRKWYSYWPKKYLEKIQKLLFKLKQ